jgi:hypothetical protein
MNEYTSFVFSKNGLPVPCSNEYLFHSRYDPAHEAELFASSFTASCRYFVVLGIAGGYHIEALLKKFPHAEILALEYSDDSLAFLMQEPRIRSLLTDRRIHAASPEDASHIFIQTYIPVYHGNIICTELRSWASYFSESCAHLKKIISDSLDAVSADFSVQCHFGKLWHRNIMLNTKASSPDNSCVQKNLDTDRTAAIIAAGPSLDESIRELTEHRISYSIIATDTAYPSLLNRGITPDAVVSIDGQAVSRCHFMQGMRKGILYVFDLCSSPCTVRKAVHENRDVLFTESGHPLAVYASNAGCRDHNESSFIHLDSGSGTVTIAAASLAYNAGFTRIAFFGADFSYKAKPYTSGTYLDTLYDCDSTRISPAETRFDALMFRTPLQKGKSEGSFTTSLLDSYRSSLETFLSSHGYRKDSNGVYTAGSAADYCNKKKYFLSERFYASYHKQLLESLSSEDSQTVLTPVTVTLLPYISYLSSHPNSGTKLSFHELVKLAYSKTLRYTESI